MERRQYNSYGRPKVVHLGSFTLPEPQADELIVRAAAISINPMDWNIRSVDVKMFIGSKFPGAMGTDSAEMGSNVPDLKAGDAAMARPPPLVCASAQTRDAKTANMGSRFCAPDDATACERCIENNHSIRKQHARFSGNVKHDIPRPHRV